MEKILKVLNQKKKYEESIAERVKKQKRQNTQKTFAPQDSSINLDNFTYGENYDDLDEEDREFLRNMNKQGKGLKILTVCLCYLLKYKQVIIQ